MKHALAPHFAPVAPARIGRVTGMVAGIVSARGLDLPVGAGVAIERAEGGDAPGVVVGFDGRELKLAAIDGSQDFVRDAIVRSDSRALLCQAGDAQRGRVIDALGRAIDGLGPQIGLEPASMASDDGPLDRAPVDRFLATGVRAIDTLLPLGRGQRLAIMAGSGVGKSTLLQQLLRGIDCDIAVVALVGERGRELSEFVDALGATRQRTVVVTATADAPAILRLRAVERANAIAHWHRRHGRHALLIVDSLTRVAHAQRELGLALGEPPTMKGYPPSALGLLPRLIEQAGGSRASRGAVTALYTVLADGDDLDDPVVDTVRGSVDGHIVLSRRLAEEGLFPAIDLGRSLSRVMPAIVTPAQQEQAREARRLWSLAEENRDLVLIGAYKPGQDAALDQALAARDRLRALIAQAPTRLIDPADARAALAEALAEAKHGVAA